MTDFEIDINKLELDAQRDKMKAFVMNAKDITYQTLAQGEFNGHWYFGKQVDVDGKKVDCLIFDDGEVLVNEQQKAKHKKDEEQFINHIKESGLHYAKPLIQLDNKWSSGSITSFISKCSSVGKCSYLSTSQNEGVEGSNTTLTAPTTLTTLTAQMPIYTNITNIQLHYMDLYKPELVNLTTCYVLATYCYELFDSIGYLFFCSDSGSGKTKWSQIIQYCSFNALNATNSSESALFRMTEQTKGLLSIDDYENIEEDKKNTIDQILKVGYKKGGKTCRAEKVGDNYVPAFYDVYCPKLITNTVGLDSITYSRCIPIHLLKTTTDKGRLNPNSKDVVWQNIRDSCYVWVMENWKTIKANYELVDVKELNNRDLELVKPILAIAKTIGEDKYVELKETVIDLFDNRDMFDFTNDWDYILFHALYKYKEMDSLTAEAWMTTKECLDLMLQDMHFDAEDKMKPSVKWVGKVLSRIDLFKKRRLSGGVEYLLSKESLVKFMKSRGWVKEVA
jgi:hypothetical protein